MKIDDDVCCYCGKSNGPGARELRPYGPGGALCCAGCTILDKSPEGRKRLRIAEERFSQMLDESTAKSGMVMLTPDGPVSIPTNN